MKFIALNNCLRVKLEPVKAKTKPIERNDGTIIQFEIPDKHNEITRIGTVMARGDRVSDNIQVGDRVAVQWSAGVVIHLTMDDYDDTDRLIPEHEVLGKIED